MLAAIAVAWCGVPAVYAESSSSHPVLSWTSTNETDAYGYIIYRATRAEGPFLRVNPRIVRVQSSTGNGDSKPASKSSKYRYVDTSAARDQTYYYYIDVISDGGLQQRMTGIVRKVPVSPDPEGSAD
jgi:hypothetical protein